MIRLTLNAQSDPEIHLFNKSTILLGAESADVDLVLPGPEIQRQHFKISEENGFLVLSNLTKDPDVSINGHPFGKDGKNLLNSGDVITAYGTTILFELLDCGSNQQTRRGVKEAPVSRLDSRIEDDSFQMKQKVEVGVPSFESFVLPFENEVEPLEKEEWEKFYLDSDWTESSLEEAEKKISAVKNAPVELANTTEPEIAQSSREQRQRSKSLKDDYLKDLDDDNQHEGRYDFESGEKSHLWHAWKWILIFIFTLFTVSAVVVSVLYYSVSDKTEAQETKAAQAVADIAMALTHAQLDHLKPDNQSWSDVDFLKRNLHAVLSNTHSYASQIDAQGHFNSCPYSLRIYTNTDLSHFLLIAQPPPSLFYWLFPKSIIVVDSHAMELRTVKDVRAINRLLADTELFERSNGTEITSLIKQGDLIRLSDLAKESGHSDFAPPNNLAWIKPGAENLIYNAPRYYRLGQGLIQKAMNLSTSKGSSQEVADLKLEVKNMSWLADLVLYCDQGKKAAQHARQGLTMYAGTDKVLYGYLTFDLQGKINKVQLLKDEDALVDSGIVNSLKEQEAEVIAFQSSLDTKVRQQEPETKTEPVVPRPAIDDNHPIHIQLQALVVAREKELKPLSAALQEMLNQELQMPKPQFHLEYQNLSHAYLMANARHKRIIKGALDSLYRQYENLPVDQFFAFVEELKLDKLMQKEDQSLALIDETCQENINTLFGQIERSKSLLELENLTQIAGSWLTFDYIQDSQDLMKYQNMLRNHLLEKLEHFFLVPGKHLMVKAEDRPTVQQILGQERLIHPEERDFFLAEFDELLNSQEVSRPIAELSEE